MRVIIYPLLGLCLSGAAYAQPVEGDEVQEPPSGPSSAPAQPPQALPPRQVQPAQAAAAALGTNKIGIGFGFTFPAQLLTPDTVSVRFRLSPKLTLEPLVNASFDRSEDTVDLGGTEVSAVSNALELSAATAARTPIFARGKVSLIGIGELAFRFSSLTVNPDGNNNNETTNTQVVALAWGVGVEWFLFQNISLSLDATNPLLVFTNSVNDEEDPAGIDVASNDIFAGVVFAPSVRLLLHLYHD